SPVRFRTASDRPWTPQSTPRHSLFNYHPRITPSCRLVIVLLGESDLRGTWVAGGTSDEWTAPGRSLCIAAVAQESRFYAGSCIDPGTGDRWGHGDVQHLLRSHAAAAAVLQTGSPGAGPRHLSGQHQSLAVRPRLRGLPRPEPLLFGSGSIFRRAKGCHSNKR